MAGSLVRNDPDFLAEGQRIIDNLVHLETLTGDVTIDAKYPNVGRFDPGGAARILTLPAEATSDGLCFFWQNTADASEDITVRDDALATVTTLKPGEMAMIYCDGTTWFATRLAGGQAGALQTDVTISTAEMLALFATPKTLVPAPGANKAIVFIGAMLFLDFNSAAYAGIAAGEDLLVSYTNGAGQEVARQETTGFLDAVADDVRWLPAQEAALAAVSDITPVANAALVASLLIAEIITGDSPVKVRTFYRIVDTAF